MLTTEVPGYTVKTISIHEKNTWGEDDGLHATSCEGVVIHIAQGPASACMAWFKNPESGASSNFLVTKGGLIYQFVELFGDAPFANGVPYQEKYVNAMHPLVRDLTRAHGALVSQNKWTWSIEHEGMSGEPWTEAMLEASSTLTAYLWTHLPPERRRIFKHADFDGINKRMCPGLSTLAWDAYYARVTSKFQTLFAAKQSPSDWVAAKQHLDKTYDNLALSIGQLSDAAAALSLAYGELREKHGMDL